MIDITELGVGDVLKDEQCGEKWEVRGSLFNIEASERTSVLVKEAEKEPASESIRTDTFDQDDLQHFQKAAS